MMSIRSIVFAAIAALGLALPMGSAALANEYQISSRGPLGFQLFCLKNPRECQPARSGKVEYNDQIMSKLKQINLSVNRSIKPRNERKGADVWKIGGGYGDCEDFALTKRSRLIRAGFPAGALRIGVARTRSGEGHAVLIVKTSKGDLVLDNLTNSIKPKSASGLRFLSVSGANPTRWAANG